MKETLEHIDQLIEQYLLNQMDITDRKAFEERIENNIAIKERLEYNKQIKKAIEQNEKVGLFSKNIREVVAENRVHKIKNIYWRLAASIVITLGIVASLYLSEDEKSNDQLIIAYFEVFPDMVTSRTDTDSIVAIAMLAYNNADYGNAIDHFQRLDRDQLPIFDLYLGVSYMSLNEYEKAMSVWLPLELDSPANLIHTVKWYAAITALALNKQEEAETRLHELATGNSSVKNQAKAILEELK